MIQDVKKIYLCTPDLKILTALNGIQTDSVEFVKYIKDYHTLSFVVDRYLSIDGRQVQSNGYDDLQVYMYLYLEDVGYFQIQEPTTSNDGNMEIKNIQAYSADKELEQKDWIGLKVNNGEDDSLEMLADGNVDDLGFSKEFVRLLYPEKPQLSFLHLMLEKLPNWSIGHIDDELKNKIIPLITVDNANIYSILTSNIAPRLDMVFQFDYLNFTINAYHRNNLDFDTNIFIGFRNLANQVTINVDEDSVYTRFRVRGEENLTFTNINYGNDQVIDLSYFMGPPHMSEDLAAKIRLWEEARDYWRYLPDDGLIALEKKAAEYNATIDSLEYRVPTDETYWKNWDRMSREALLENQKLFEAQLVALQNQVDPRSYDECHDQNKNYLPYLDGQGNVDHQRYLDLHWNYEGGQAGYFTYKELILYILPEIQLALNNENLPSDQKVRFEKDSEEEWELYGYYELDGKRKSYEEDKLPALNKFKKKWNDMTNEEIANYVNEESYRTQGRSEYIHIWDMLWGVDLNSHGEVASYHDKTNPKGGTIYSCLNILKARIQQAKDRLSYVQRDINELTQKTQLNTNARDKQGNLLFSEEEIKIISRLLIDNDYTNSNILATSIDDTTTKLDREKELYDDAVLKLSEVCRPQYTFELDMDNMLRIPQFQGWVDDLDLMHFIRLGIRDDYAVKLRVIEMSYNPCEVDENLRIVFSSMISSKSGRNDLTQIIDDENNRGQKNSISIGNGNSKDATEYASTLLTLMVKSGLFNQQVRQVASQVVGQLDQVGVNNAIASYMENTNQQISHLIGTTEDYESLAEDVLSVGAAGEIIESVVSTTTIDGANISTTNLTANSELVRFLNSVIDVDQLSAETVISALVSAQTGDFDELTAGSAFIDYLNSGVITTGTITAESLVSTMAQITDAQIQNLSADSAFIQYLNSGIIETGTVSAETVIAALVEAEEGDFDELTANTAFVQNILTVGTDAITTIAEGTITTENVIATLVQAQSGDFDELTANSAFIQYVKAETVDADSVIAAIIDADQGNFDQLFANSAFIDYLESNLIVSQAAHITNLTADLATINVADVNQLAADSAFILGLQTLSSTAAQSVITDAYIYNAVANKIAVADLAAGDITISNSMRILSENGKMIMNGSALQILGEDSNGDPYVGVQLGYATNGQPSLVLRNEDGAVIVDPTGITADAVADGLIINNMIHDGTISESKLGFNVMKEGDTISIEQVYTGNGSFGVEYTSFKNTTQEALDEMGYFLYIDAPNGKNVKGGNIVLNAVLYKNCVDVTSQWDASHFIWERKSKDTDGDRYWNNAHQTGTKSLTVTANDVTIEADFECRFEVDGVTVTSS